MADDTAQQLRIRCENQRSLKDTGVDPALHAIRQHSASSTRFVQVLAQLARYKVDVARRDDEMGREVCAAVEARRATLDVGYDALKLCHPQLAESVGETDSDGLLGRLASEAEAARASVETAKRHMPSLEDLSKLPEEEWRQLAVVRDQALQDQVQLSELRLEGLRAKQRCLERALSVCELNAGLPEVLAIDAFQADMSAVQASAGASPLLTTCAELVRSVQEMHEMFSAEVLAEVAAIAARISEERAGCRRTLQTTLQAVSAKLRAARLELEPWAELYKRRCSAEALLSTLENLQAEVREVRKEERMIARKLEDLAEETGPGDPSLDRTAEKLKKVKDRVASLSLRRDGLVAEVVALSATQVGAHGLALGVGDGAEEAAVQLEFPELPVRAQRIVLPFQAYGKMDAAARARFDVEVMLRWSGLLACDRKYASYSELAVIVPSKPNVKRATLRGAAHASALKILKEYGVGEFKRVKRAVTNAGRLRHPGIVPVECAFLELGGSVVVVQSPLYAGGNMREWSRGQDAEAKLRACQRVAEAVRFLHAHAPPILHRDIKLENVVFESSSASAAPALCDFDLSIHAADTLTTTTRMVGTLLYLSPDPTPSCASDVFSLGMTLLDVLFCDADEEALRRWVLGSARERGAVDAANLERVRQDLAGRTEDEALAMLVREMLALDPGARPDASAVAETLGGLLAVRTCCVCHCPEPRDKGLECAAAARHFACDECFSAHAGRLEAVAESEGESESGSQSQSGGVRCCMAGCSATHSLQAAAAHASQLAFETLCRHIDDRKHVAMEGEFERWKEGFQADFAAKSEHERRCLAARLRVEEMMELRCPKCRRVFGQFTGCAALTCAYAGCNAHFCAFCLVDCGGDAHPHVRTCSLNPKKNEYFVSEAEWARVVDGQRREKLQAYWAELEPAVKEALAADASVSQVLRDLRLDRLLGAAAFAEQMAQLRGMGFADERAMREVLREVRGDVSKALELLCAVEG